MLKVSYFLVTEFGIMAVREAMVMTFILEIGSELAGGADEMGGCSGVD